MKDFTLEAYKQYLQAIKRAFSNILRFDDFFLLTEIPENFIIIRHDVDRKPKNALKMAEIESEKGIHSTYYFRTKPHVFRPEIIRAIVEKGHEIGYHYESLSDARGDYSRAMADFEKNLNKLRQVTPITTIAMHGSPLSPHDNRDLWKDPERNRLLKEKYGILGEVYLDIDYSYIAYINDTGRNWLSDRSNIRDKIVSITKPNFKNGQALLDCFKDACHSKVVFQIHPERWTDSGPKYCIQWAKDQFANIVKSIIR